MWSTYIYYKGSLTMEGKEITHKNITNFKLENLISPKYTYILYYNSMYLNKYHVCMYVCMPICLFICMFVCMYVLCMYVLVS